MIVRALPLHARCVPVRLRVVVESAHGNSEGARSTRSSTQDPALVHQSRSPAGVDATKGLELSWYRAVLQRRVEMHRR